ncbi:hypothetical protein P280DRAFT_481404 [Massarina eburnea CBS 473.64]|uniref:Uncharacterized protein n=1 Tax=Massarina eburnea CBS 473.64 TaxID=1395130 RepID=A0A6A6RWW6_9PLEO|nr:hypothetical protein P280DRAFT_481404 [Massarina eburnea CBS 473.64]
MPTIASPLEPARQGQEVVSMTGEKKTSEPSGRLGVKRQKPTSSSPARPTDTPPKTAVATTNTKPKDETQRRKNYFNDMLNHRSNKEKEKGTRRSTSSKHEESEAPKRASPDSHGSIDGAAERIAELERTLATVLEEQHAMREELAKARDQGASADSKRNSNHGHHLQSPLGPPGAFHSDSRPTTPSPAPRSIPVDIDDEASPRRRTPRRSFNHHRSDLSVENYDLRAQVAQLQDQIQAQELAFQSRLRTETDWYELTSRLHTTEKESQERLQQLLSLKSSISSLTRMDSQVTDSELTESFSQLANRVREWVITNFRRAKLNLTNLPPDVVLALEDISPTYQRIEDRLPLYQALISNVLMHIFREPILVGLPEHGPLAAVRKLAECLYNPSPEYREWRRCTIRSIENTEGTAVQREKEKLMHLLAGEIGHQLHKLTSVNLTQNAQSALVGILNAAADLQHTLLQQKAQYRMCFFRHMEDIEIDFDESSMESINDFDGSVDDDGDVIVDRKFAFCVFPCLEKWGDEYGENTAARNVLLKARVCCGVG